MKILRINGLSPEQFKKYGEYHQMLNPDAERLGPPPVEFYRDICSANLNGACPSFSVTRLTKRALIAEKFEYHNNTAEAFLPLDGDIIVHLAPAGRTGQVPYDKIEAFRIPKGTMAVIKPGVWHAAPFAEDKETVHVLVVLPERTYENDCNVMAFPEEEKLQLT